MEFEETDYDTWHEKPTNYFVARQNMLLAHKTWFRDQDINNLNWAVPSISDAGLTFAFYKDGDQPDNSVPLSIHEDGHLAIHIHLNFH